MLRAIGFAVAGLLFGSFLTVLIHRLPRKESVVGGRSKCPSCGATIRARDNIPLVSYLLLGGRCRACRARISPEYPLVELATAALFAAAAAAFDHPVVAGMVALLLALLLAVGVIDARHRIIPNRLMYPSLGLFAVLIVGAQLADGDVSIARGAMGLVAYGGGLLLLALAVPRGMGMGDVKLAAVIGLVLGSLGLGRVGVAAAAAIVFGGLVGVAALTVGGKSRKQAIPFGPSMAAGAVVAVFIGPQIASAYLGLF
jgi:leader peptidase (prepilin peptidase) / N-methyltransferase